MTAESTGGDGPRRQPPPVTGEEDQELSGSNGTRAQPVKPATREPKNFGQTLDWSKLEYGKKLIGWCIFLTVGLSLISYFFPRNGSAINGSLEMLKLITTTALGFVFAKSIYDKDSDGTDD